MSEDTEAQFSEEFLHEVDAAEAAALQSRGICCYQQAVACLACSTTSTTPVDFNENTGRANTLAASTDTPAYAVQEPTTRSQAEGCLWTVRTNQPGRRPDSSGDAGCNGDRGSDESVTGRREDYLKTGDIFTYRWKVDRISVRDCTTRAEEVVGQVCALVASHPWLYVFLTPCVLFVHGR